MKNQDLELKLQAWVDGELSDCEAKEVEAWLDQDSSAQALRDELRHTKAALTDNEVACPLPESREFFWSKIEREITRQAAPAPVSLELSWFVWLQRHFLPISGVALLCCLLGVFTIHTDKSAGLLPKLELASDDMRAYTFRDPQQQMTMVWLYSDDSQFTAPPSLASMDTE